MSGYPDNHPKAAEIREEESAIDKLYKEFADHEELSRQYYKQAMEGLRSMGNENKAIHDALKAVAGRLERLKALIDSPLI